MMTMTMTIKGSFVANQKKDFFVIRQLGESEKKSISEPKTHRALIPSKIQPDSLRGKRKVAFIYCQPTLLDEPLARAFCAEMRRRASSSWRRHLQYTPSFGPGA